MKNRRHRGVTTPFDQRSRGFIWFFSFLVWFDSVQAQLTSSGVKASSDLILLLDEPGLALHALAQEDFLNYIDNLSASHQVIYTTHSPFMVRSSRLKQVRIVEDKQDVGTIVSENLSGSILALSSPSKRRWVGTSHRIFSSAKATCWSRAFLSSPISRPCLQCSIQQVNLGWISTPRLCQSAASTTSRLSLRCWERMGYL
nr:AAA family ATPase [Pseudomonas viridiflava]